MKAVWTRSTTRYQFPVFGSCSHITDATHPWRCSTHICECPARPLVVEAPDCPLDLVPLGERVVYGKWIYPHRDIIPQGIMRVYSVTLSAGILTMETREVGGGWLVATLYHLFIHCSYSLSRSGLDARRGSTSAPASANFCCLYLWRKTLIRCPIVLFLE